MSGAETAALAITEFAGNYRMVPLEWIKVKPGRRPVKEEAVQALIGSIEDHGGLLQPINALRDGTLVCGNHRYEAYRRLGRTHIPCLVVDWDELHAELAEIDENLLHRRLSPLEESVAVARRKEIYEELHPKAKHGAGLGSEVGRGRNRSLHNADSYSKAPSFVRDTMAKSGQGRGTVERSVRIGEGFTPLEMEKLKEARMPVLTADQLARLKVKEPEQVAAVLAAPAGEMRHLADELVGLVEPKRGPRALGQAQPTPSINRKQAKDNAARLKATAEASPTSRCSTQPTCQTEKYSTLGAHDQQAARRTVRIGANPAEAAQLLADHFDREGMEGLFYYLLRYLTRRSVLYVLRLYGKEPTDERSSVQSLA